MLDGCVPWPAHLADEYRRSGYWRGDTLGGLLRSWADQYGDRTALVGSGTRVGYAELDAWADRVAAGFHRLGVRAGDRVVVQLPNVPEFVAVCFGLFRLGALPIFALPAHRGNEIKHLCGLSGAVAYVIPDRHLGFDYRTLAEEVVKQELPDLRHVVVAGDPGAFTPLSELAAAEPIELPEPDPQDVAFFLLSGGTTALPKLIPRTHDDYAYQGRLTAGLCGLDDTSVYLTVLPVPFNFTWGCPGVVGALQAGGTVVFAKSPSPDECFPLIEAEGVTITSLVPTVLHLWLEAAEWTEADLSSLRMIQVGSAKLHREVAELVQPTFDCELQQVFGMAEGLLCFTREDDDADTVVSTQGRPVSPSDEIRIVDGDDREVEPGQPGELLTRGPYTLCGYYRAPEHNAKAFTEDGFYRSGDLVSMSPSGNLVVEGRVKDVIIRGGDKVSSVEIEAHLTAHPDVRQAAVVPVPDKLLGERICAYVIAGEQSPRLVDLKNLLRSRGLADYKLPDRLELVEEFPLTGLGKVDKKALAARIAEKVGNPR